MKTKNQINNTRRELMLDDLFNRSEICGTYELYELMLDLRQFGLTEETFNPYPHLYEQYERMIKDKDGAPRYSVFMEDLMINFFIERIHAWWREEYPKFMDFVDKQNTPWNSNYICDYREYRMGLIEQYTEFSNRVVYTFFDENTYDDLHFRMKKDDPTRYADYVESGLIDPDDEEPQLTAEEVERIFKINEPNC